MKKTDVKLNATYLVKVAGNLVPVRIDREHDNGGWMGTSRKTGKSIRIKSPQRLRKRIDDVAPRAKRAAKATKDATDAPKRDTGERAATGGQREANEAKPKSLLDAAAHLRTGDAMRCKDSRAGQIRLGQQGLIPAITISQPRRPAGFSSA